MPNYGAKQPMSSAYVKTFNIQNNKQNWHVDENKRLTPANSKLDVFIKKDLIVIGDIITNIEYRTIGEESIPLISDDINSIMKLKPCKYVLKNEFGEDDLRLCLNAEEVEEVMPHLITTVVSGVNSDINPVIKAVRYNDITTLLIAQVQQLQEQINSLKNDG
jgi:hypothetical protein